MEKKNCVVCVIFVTAVVLMGWLSFTVLTRNSHGKLVVDITKFNITNTTDPIKVGVETGGEYTGYSPWRNDTLAMRVSYRNVTTDQDVTVTGSNMVSKNVECKITFTVDKMAKSGYLNLYQDYKVTDNCTIRMKVNWIPEKTF